MNSLRRLWLRLPDHLQHSVVAAMILELVALPWWLLGLPLPAVAGALAGIAFYWGREARDAETFNTGLADRLAVLWPPNWHADSRSDFYWPAATCAGLAAAIETVRAAW